MALISPGVQVTVTDESQYQPTAAGTIPLILLATAQDKFNPSGTLATGTTTVNSDKLITITSQRELISTFGYPTFQLDANGNPINASELNEYGLLAAYSALGVANRVYVQRANVDLNQLTGTSIRPTGEPSDGVYWLDQSLTTLGLFEFDAATGGFTNTSVTPITDTAYLSGATPISSYGAIGDYAINSTDGSNPLYYKRYDNTWTLVGSAPWQLSQPTITGTSIPSGGTALQIGDALWINNSQVAISGTTVADVAADITAAHIKGVIATVNEAGYLEIRANAAAITTGNVSATPNGNVLIKSDLTSDCAVKLGLFTTAEVTANIHISGKTIATPTIQYSDYRDTPAWIATDTLPRPSGSIWFKTSAIGNGANWAFKQYNATNSAFGSISAPLYANDNAALLGLDPTGGGTQISVGAVYVRYDTAEDNTAKFTAYVKDVAGILKITGTATNPTFDASHNLTIEVSVPGTLSTSSATINLSSTTAQSLVADILAANLPNLVANLESTGAISLTHLAGGTIRLTDVGSGTTVATAGWNNDSNVTLVGTKEYLASPFIPLTYTFSSSAPYSDPADGTLWYYNDATEVDIMINDGSGWKGYRTVGNDARGYDLTATDSAGPIISTIAPAVQSNGDPVVAGDLWIDTSNLFASPVIYRFDGVAWNLIDNTDQISSNGITFADVRWGVDGTEDPIVDALPAISDLVNSSYIDSDAPDYALSPRGGLLFNTRRSGFNVKRFESNYLTDHATVGANFVAATWVTHSGVNTTTGVPYFGGFAQRNTVVEALKASVEASTNVREERVEFNLICAPGYPELIQNMITLNNDRKQTAFIIGDSPLTLPSDSTQITNWATNAGLAAENGLFGLVSHSEYLGVYYPSGLATNLDGNSVVVPPSHSMLRAIIRSDNQSYPWFAPAGVRRGVLDNITAIGYVDATDNFTFKSIGVTAGLRDTLYENNVNPLTVLPGVGLVAYGQKTRASSTTALDRINVARLVCYLRLVLDKTARSYIFEPNDTITRNQVKSSFEAVLNDLVAKRGIYDYVVQCDETNNTPDRIDRNELYVDIAIEPVKSIEFIYIPVRIKGTGEIAAGL